MNANGNTAQSRRPAEPSPVADSGRGIGELQMADFTVPGREMSARMNVFGQRDKERPASEKRRASRLPWTPVVKGRIPDFRFSREGLQIGA